MQRTEASYKAFIEGLFGADAWNIVPGPPVENPDFLLRVCHLNSIFNIFVL